MNLSDGTLLFLVCSSTNNHLSSLQVYFMTHLKGPSRTHWTKLMNTYDTHWCISINNLQKHVFTWKYILHFRTFYITALNFKAADRPVLSPCHSFHHCVFWGWVKKTHWDEDTTHAFKVFFCFENMKTKILCCGLPRKIHLESTRWQCGTCLQHLSESELKVHFQPVVLPRLLPHSDFVAMRHSQRADHEIHHNHSVSFSDIQWHV